jgi:HK97 family phage major capsid protein
MRSKEIRVKRAKIISDALALTVKAKPSVEDIRRSDQMLAEAERLMLIINRIERADALEAESLEALRNGGIAGPRTSRDAEERTFRAWMRGGLGAIKDPAALEIYDRSFQAAQSTSSDVGGGYTVPEGFARKLVNAEKAYGGMIGAAFIMDTETGNAIPVPTDNDTVTSGAILGENVQTGTQDIPFGAVTFNAYTYTSKLVLVSNQMLQDSAFDVETWLAEKLGTRIGRATNAHFTTGTGAAQPTGVLTAGSLGYTAGGSTTSGSTTTVTYDDLLELEHSVDPAYRKKASFMMGDGALKVVKKLKDGLGRPLWRGGVAEKAPDTINGYPFVINLDFPAMAASAKSIAFGNFQNYFVRRVAGTQLRRLTERYADFNQVGFIAFQRWDGQLVDAGTHPIRYLQQSAS